MLSSTFHSLSIIAGQLSPGVDSSGINVLHAENFKLHSFQSLTGINFVVVTSTDQSGMESLLRNIYRLYADFVLKNPFYTLDMPIRCQLFDSHLQQAVAAVDRRQAYSHVRSPSA